MGMFVHLARIARQGSLGPHRWLGLGGPADHFVRFWRGVRGAPALRGGISGGGRLGGRRAMEHEELLLLSDLNYAEALRE
ncbi:MAG: hypothetical protein D6815_06270, partial [Candidatus Dadabacteria bacterium]